MAELFVPPLKGREPCQLGVEAELNGVDWAVAMFRDADLREVVQVFSTLGPDGEFCVAFRFAHRVVVLFPKDEEHNICVLLDGAAIS
jgi:hypothetical protein